MGDVVFELKELVYTYPDGTAGLRGVSAVLRQGQKIAVLGANGAGKTTLFCHMVGVHRPAEGRIYYRGRPLAYNQRALQQLRRKVGMVFQDPDAQLFSASVYQDVSFGPLNLGLSEGEVRRRVEQALAVVGMRDLAARPTHALSYGEKKRVALAGVLAMKPEVLICDEPTAGLDPHGAVRMVALLRKLHAQGTTIIFSTHDVDLAYKLADWCLVLSNGRLIGEGPPADVFLDEKLLAAANLVRPWLLEVFAAARRRGLVAVGDRPPACSEAFMDAVERFCRDGRKQVVDEDFCDDRNGVAAELAEKDENAAEEPETAGNGSTGAGSYMPAAVKSGGTLRPQSKKSSASLIYQFYERPMSPAEIEAESFRRIDNEAPPHHHPPMAWSVVRRLIHTTADFGLVEATRFAPGAVEAGIKALRRGAPIFADSNMIRAGISLARLQRVYPGYTPADIHCLVADPAVVEDARATGLPRSLFGVRRAGPILEGGIALFGNAPLALLELNRMIREGEVRPALVVAMPVGFVHVEESKEELMELDVPYICVAGRRGGSSLAVAALHALTILAVEGTDG
jgi:cobalt/nickel transport system ATP-binding protein